MERIRSAKAMKDKCLTYKIVLEIECENFSTQNKLVHEFTPYIEI